MFVQSGAGITIWDNLQHQVFSGDDGFADKHQIMQNELTRNLSEIPFKQRRKPSLSINQDQK